MCFGSPPWLELGLGIRVSGARGLCAICFGSPTGLELGLRVRVHAEVRVAVGFGVRIVAGSYIGVYDCVGVRIGIRGRCIGLLLAGISIGMGRVWVGVGNKLGLRFVLGRA